MKGSLKVWLVILGIVAAGTGVTHMTNSYVTHQIEKMAAAGTEKAEAQSSEDRLFFSMETEAGRAEEALEAEAAESDSAWTGADVQVQAETLEETKAGRSQTGRTGDVERESVLGQEESGIREYGQQGNGQEESASGEAGRDKAGQDGVKPKEDGGTFEISVAKAADTGGGASAGVQVELAEGNVLADENGVTDEAAPAAAAEEKSPVLEIVEYPTDLQEALSEYRERFPQIDRQIEQMRSSDTENNVYSVKTAAQTELRIWERELEKLYRLLCDRLDETAGEELQKEQQEWTRLRDDRAEEAAKKNSGGSLESVDYFASMAASNRERAYALLDKYQEQGE